MSFNSTERISLTFYAKRKLSYSASACTFTVYLKYIFSSIFKCIHQNLKPFFTGSWRLFTLCTLLSFRTITQNKGGNREEKQKRVSMIYTSKPHCNRLSFLHDFPAHGVAENSIKEKMMPQAAIVSEQVFFRTGTVAILAYNIWNALH